jgi:hypothetical protein
MRFSRKPKFGVGDIVDLLPYEDFTEHISIPQWFWNRMYAKNPQTIKTVIPGQHTVPGNPEPIENIYYSLSGSGYSWCEEFLVEHIKLLPDDLFEV